MTYEIPEEKFKEFMESIQAQAEELGVTEYLKTLGAEKPEFQDLSFIFGYCLAQFVVRGIKPENVVKITIATLRFCGDSFRSFPKLDNEKEPES